METDETWIQHYTPESAQWLLLGKNRPELQKQQQSAGNVLAIFFPGIHMELFLSISNQYYCALLYRLNVEIKGKRSYWMILLVKQDNAPSDSAFHTFDKLNNWSRKLVLLLSVLQIWRTAIIYSFPYSKTGLLEKKFHSNEEVRMKTNAFQGLEYQTIEPVWKFWTTVAKCTLL